MWGGGGGGGRGVVWFSILLTFILSLACSKILMLGASSGALRACTRVMVVVCVYHVCVCVCSCVFVCASLCTWFGMDDISTIVPF